jgi:hypothetical protein
MGKMCWILPRIRPVEHAFVQTARRRPVYVVKNAQQYRTEGLPSGALRQRNPSSHSLTVVRQHMGHSHAQQPESTDEDDHKQVRAQSFIFHSTWMP